MGEQRVAVVTGASPGSRGEESAQALRERGFRVLTTARRAVVGPDTHPLDLAARDSVAACAAWVAETTERLDVLVNNARVHLDLASAWHEPRLVDGVEVHWRTNYLGPAQLTRLLLPLLLVTAETYGEARVVNVVSELHERGRNEGLDGHLSPYDSWTAYGTSALALVHEARELEERYGARGLHGYAATRGAARGPARSRRRHLPTTVVCACSPDAVPGGYHHDGVATSASEEARDTEAGRLLWEATERWLDRG